MPLDYNSAMFLPLLGVCEGQTVILKGLAYLQAVRRLVPAPFDDAFQCSHVQCPSKTVTDHSYRR